MKIINTLKSYFKNEEIKKDYTITTIDNVYDKDTSNSLDYEIEMLKKKCDFYDKYFTRYDYDLTSVDDQNDHFGLSQLSVSVIAGYCIITGRLATSTNVSGGEVIKFPVNLSPNVEYVGYGTTAVIDGVEYKIRLVIEQSNPSQMYIYFYDEIPSGKSVLINMVYPLDIFR